jgi:hypothetical protein
LYCLFFNNRPGSRSLLPICSAVLVVAAEAAVVEMLLRPLPSP